MESIFRPAAETVPGSTLPLAPPDVGLAARFREFALRTLRRGGVNQHALWTFGDQAVVSGTNFLTGIIIGRTCPREQFGLYVLGFYVIVAATELQSSLISSPYTIFRPRLADAEARRVTGAVLLLQLAYAAAISGIVWLVAAVLGRGYGPAGLAPLLAVLGAVIPCTLLREHLRRVSFAALRVHHAVMLDAAAGFMQVALLLTLAFTAGLTAERGIVAGCAASGVAAVAWLLVNRSDWVVRGVNVRQAGREIWGLGRWMSASGILSQLTAQLFPWFLAAFAGSGTTAVWAACGSITSVVNPAILGLTNYLTPAAATAYAQRGTKGLRRVITNTSLLYVAAMTPFCLVLIVAGERVVTLLYGHAYAGTDVLVALLAINLIPTGLSFIYSRGLFALEQAEVDFRVNLIPLAATLVAGLFLVRPFGISGGMGGVLAGAVLAAIARYWRFDSHLRRAV